MRHLTSPVLRRLADEPLAVADAARCHLEGCARCQAAGAAAAADADFAARALGAPAAALAADPDTDRAWAQLQERLHAPGAPARRPARPPRRAGRGLARLSVGTGTALAAGLVAAGAGAAVVISTVYAPTQVAPVPVTRQDLTTIASIAQLGGPGLTDGLPPSGTRQLPFGQLTWSSAGAATQVSSVAAARALTHLPLAAPARLPAGVGSPAAVMVAPQVTATIAFSQAAGPGVGGSTLVITAGPAVLVRYGSADGQASLPALAVAIMRRPSATSAGASAGQLEHFLLTRSGLPAGLADELRLLGTTTLPVPVPAGVPTARVQVGGSPGVLVADPSGAASGVVWESRDGMVHGVAGLLDRKDVLDVASQLG